VHNGFVTNVSYSVGHVTLIM